MTNEKPSILVNLYVLNNPFSSDEREGGMYLLTPSWLLNKEMLRHFFIWLSDLQEHTPKTYSLEVIRNSSQDSIDIEEHICDTREKLIDALSYTTGLWRNGYEPSDEENAAIVKELTNPSWAQ